MDIILNKENLLIIGEAVLLASMQFSIGSVEMSSKFSVKNFSKDQETLQNAADSLSDYMRIGLFWTFGLTLLFYAKFDFMGSAVCLLANLLIMTWIYMSYIEAFTTASNTYHLKMPTISII